MIILTMLLGGLLAAPVGWLLTKICFKNLFKSFRDSQKGG